MDEETEKILENHEERIKKLESTKTLDQDQKKNGERESSLKEFMNKYKVKKDTDKTLLIIYYLEKFKGKESVCSKDIGPAFREIREKPPKNISDKFYKLSKRGFIMEVKIKRQTSNFWRYTTSGEEYIVSLKK